MYNLKALCPSNTGVKLTRGKEDCDVSSVEDALDLLRRRNQAHPTRLGDAVHDTDDEIVFVPR